MHRVVKLTISSLLTLSLAGCASLSEPDKGQNPPPKMPAEQAQQDTPSAIVDEPPIEYSKFDQDTLYSLMAAEIAAQRGRYDVTLVNYVDAAKKSRDVGVIKRALRIAQSLKGNNAQLQLAKLWLDIDPENLEAHRIAAIQYVRKKQYNKAVAQMEKILQQGENADFDDLAVLASTQSQDDQKRLLAIYQDLAKRYPENRDIQYGIALLRKSAKQYDEALATLDPLLNDSDREPYQNAMVLRGDLLYQTGRKNEALDYLEDQADEYPDNRKLGTLYGRMLIDAKKLDEAEDQFEDLNKRFPEVPGLTLSYALVAMENDHTDDAKKALETLITQKHHVNEAHFYLGLIADRADDTDEAIYQFSQVSRGKNLLPALSRLTALRAKNGEQDQAMADLRALRQQEPDLAEQLWLVEINTLLDLEENDDALGAATEALQDYPDNQRIRYARAMLFDQMDRPKEAEADLREIIKAEPENAVALNALGYILTVKTDRLDEARELLEKAQSLDPGNPAILDSVGWIHFKLGDIKKSLEYLKTAYKAFPDPEVADHYGEALYVDGQKKAARDIWKAAMEDNPDNKQIPKTMQRLGAEPQS